MPQAFLNGELVPAEQATIPVYDTGFVMGATVAEQIRTFRGELFCLERHLRRLKHSLEIVGIDSLVDLTQVEDGARQLARRNHAELDFDDDLALVILVTPGPYPTMAPTRNDSHNGPLVCIHTYPLPFRHWFENYRRGQTLRVTEVTQVPTTCWPAELKCRSRMHYYLADLKARTAEPGARALLLDQQGYALEASTANLVVYHPEFGLLSPPEEKILPGVSVHTLAELAERLGIPFSQRDLTVQDVAAADEVMLCSTSPCVWPVVRLNGEPIADGAPGPRFQQLLEAWGEQVGLDIAAQARHFANRCVSQ